MAPISITLPHEVNETNSMIRASVVGLRLHLGSSFLLKDATEHPVSAWDGHTTLHDHKHYGVQQRFHTDEANLRKRLVITFSVTHSEVISKQSKINNSLELT